METIQHQPVTLDDKYNVVEGDVYLTGIQAIVRVLLDQRRADARAGLDTGGFVSGYPGSPVGGIDIELTRQRSMLEDQRIVFVPGLNEDLAATAVFGSQTVTSLPGATVGGVLGMWFGKAPGVDRSADAFRHANLRGVDPNGGVLVVAGDDPDARSSMLPTDSNQAFHDWKMPILFPGSVQDILDLGLHGYALSRASGLFAGFKIVTNIADGAGTAVVHPNRIRPVVPTVELDGVPFVPRLRLNEAGPPMREAERELMHGRLTLARAYIRANRLNPVEIDPTSARIGLVAPGKSFYDLRHALTMLGLGETELRRYGIRLMKVGALYPVDPAEFRHFARGLQEIIVVEEKRPFLETFIKDALYGSADSPRVIGKRDEHDNCFLPEHGELTPDIVAQHLGTRLDRTWRIEQVAVARARLDRPKRAYIPLEVNRTAYFCSGCPHNRSLIAPEGASVGAGIGCHVMALIVPRDEYGELAGYTQMGGEGAQWVGIAPFTETSHMFQNLGDGTFHHSGSLAIRFAVASRTNITYKLLYNSAVGMTGGQDVQGAIPVPDLTRLLQAEGVRRIIVTTDEPRKYRRVSLASIAEVWHRDRLLEAQELLAETVGTTVLIHDQQCAAEKRRLRKRDRLPEPTQRIVINERVCEACGDCGRKSQCLSVQAVETPFGRKTKIDQSSCNLDYSCLLGDCPSFVTVETKGARKRPAAQARPPLPDPPSAVVPSASFSVLMAGIGGTGVVTVSQILATAATLDGKRVRDLDLTGSSQKAGPVVSQLQIFEDGVEPSSTIAEGGADVLLAFDILTAVLPANLDKASSDRTVGVMSTSRIPTGRMSVDLSLPFPELDGLVSTLAATTRLDPRVTVDTQGLAQAICGNPMVSNMILVGAAYQAGALPITLSALESAIQMNGNAVEDNLAALHWGRVAVADPSSLPALTRGERNSDSRVAAVLDGIAGSDELVDELSLRVADLIGFQDARYAQTYVDVVKQVASSEAHLGREGVTLAVATYLHRFMAYKDEYEVARLHLESAARLAIEEEFGHDVTVYWNLHPPFLRAMGLNRKIRLGPWFAPVFKSLAAMKRVRGRRIDPFGRAHVRRIERALVDHYRRLVDDAISRLDNTNYELILELVSAADVVRGYEEIKLANTRNYIVAVEDLAARVGVSASTDGVRRELERRRPISGAAA